MKKLILNADDFCLSPVFNGVIINLFKEEIISSTSVMVKRYTDEQKDQIEELKNITTGIGLHVEFETDQDFLGQITQQYNVFIDLFGKEPSHLDIHKTDYLEAGYSSIINFANNKKLPFCNHGFESHGGVTTTKQSIGAIHNSLDAIVIWLESFSINDTSELVLHPGRYDKDCKTSLNYEREVEIIKAKVMAKYCKDNDIEVISFKAL